MIKLLLKLQNLIKGKKIKSSNLPTGIRTEIMETNDNIKRIEVYGAEHIDPLAIMLKRVDHDLGDYPDGFDPDLYDL